MQINSITGAYFFDYSASVLTKLQPVLQNITKSILTMVYQS